jgi:hypothetical protein
MSESTLFLCASYVLAGIVFHIATARARSTLAEYWRQECKGFERWQRPLLGIVFFVLIVVLWPFGVVGGFVERRRERQLKKKAELIGMLFGGGVEYEGGDGSNFENAVVIVGANQVSGVGAEHRWLRRHYPGYKLISQALVDKGDQKFDLLEYDTKTGERRTVYFNITQLLR